MKFMVPQSSLSPTSAPGLMDALDDHVYSSGIFAHGATNPLNLFTVPQGQAGQVSKGSAISSTNWPAHYTMAQTELHTSMEQAGQLGHSQGDASIRAIGVTFDTASISAAGVVGTYGATPVEVQDLNSKCWVEFTITRKRKSMGPLFCYPNLGTGAYTAPGASTTATASTVALGYAQNGFGGGRKLKVAIGISKTDTPVFKITPAAALVFSATASPGQPVLMWVTLFANVAREVR